MLSKLAAVFRAIRGKLTLARYNDFTIAEYFRKQGAKVGTDSRLLIRSLGSEPWLVRIGDHVTISFNVTLLTHDGAAWVFAREFPSIQKFGQVEILDNCFIGAGAIIMPGVRIGPNSIVGAGALVSRDVAPNSVVAGVPARPMCSLEDYRKKLLDSWEVQRPAGYLDELIPGTRYSAPVIHAHKVAATAVLRRHLERLFWGSS